MWSRHFQVKATASTNVLCTLWMEDPVPERSLTFHCSTLQHFVVHQCRPEPTPEQKTFLPKPPDSQTLWHECVYQQARIWLCGYLLAVVMNVNHLPWFFWSTGLHLTQPPREGQWYAIGSDALILPREHPPGQRQRPVVDRPSLQTSLNLKHQGDISVQEARLALVWSKSPKSRTI